MNVAKAPRLLTALLVTIATVTACSPRATNEARDVEPTSSAAPRSSREPSPTAEPNIVTTTPPRATSETTPRPSRRPKRSDGPWMIGFYPGYQRDLMPANTIDWDSMTHITVGRVLPLPDGSLDTTYDIDPVAGPRFA